MSAAGGRTADATAMDDLLGKLVAISAESFVDAEDQRPASTSRRWSSAPASTRASSSASGSARSATKRRIGMRDGEVSVAKIDQASMKNAMQALDFAVDAEAAAAPAGAPRRRRRPRPSREATSARGCLRRARRSPWQAAVPRTISRRPLLRAPASPVRPRSARATAARPQQHLHVAVDRPCAVVDLRPFAEARRDALQPQRSRGCRHRHRTRS